MIDEVEENKKELISKLRKSISEYISKTVGSCADGFYERFDKLEVEYKSRFYSDDIFNTYYAFQDREIVRAERERDAGRERAAATRLRYSADNAEDARNWQIRQSSIEDYSGRTRSQQKDWDRNWDLG